MTVLSSSEFVLPSRLVAGFGLAFVLAACSGAPGSGGQGNAAANELEPANEGVPNVGNQANVGNQNGVDAPAAVPVSIQARIAVSRTDSSTEPLDLAENADVGAGQSSEAMAQFAQLERGASETLVAAGLAPVALRPGQCVGPAEGNSGSFSDLGEIQLLDVGEVTLLPLSPQPLSPQPLSPQPFSPPVDGASRTSDAPTDAPVEAAPVAVSLAPHAFPSVSSFISGVVYTSRDRSAGALPSGVGYEISVAGSSELPGFGLRAEAPAQLQQVTVGGEPLAALAQVGTQAPLDVTWSVGNPGDVVVVALGTAADGNTLVRCAFADEVGAGTVPLEWLSAASGAGQVTLHRQRTQQTVRTAPDGRGHLIQVSFDFETNRAIEFTK